MSNEDIKARVGQPFGFYEKSVAVKHLLQPPVGNHLIFGREEQLKVMFVGGPNNRPDYHINEGEELFFQLKGPLDLKIVEHDKPRTVRIEQGQMFLLPARVPHSPQRFADSCGLVIERERLPTEWDALRWFVDDSGAAAQLEILYEDYFHCHDLGVQLKPAIEKYLASEPCRTRIPPEGTPNPNPPILVDSAVSVPAPFDLAPALAALPPHATTKLAFPSTTEVVVQAVKGTFSSSLLDTFPAGQVPKELFLWRVAEGAQGGCSASCPGSGGAGTGAGAWELAAGQALYVKARGATDLQVSQQDGTLLVVYNKVYQPSPNDPVGQ